MNGTPLDAETLALVVGFGGQALFSARMLVQWVASERQRRSVVPEVFWHLSLAGGLSLLLYAVWRRDPVFVLGQLTGVVVYVRNLWLIRAHKRRAAGQAPDRHGRRAAFRRMNLPGGADALPSSAPRAALAAVPGSAWRTLALAWLLVTAVGLLRPLLPVDETRYVAVAWEMWLRGDFVLPVLDGEPYHHKPPLLFWLLHAGWAVFGVNGWWPRLIAPLFAAGTLAVCALLGRALWPQRPHVAATAPLVLLATPLFAYFATALMFDMLLSFFVALGWLGLWRAATTGWRPHTLALVSAGLAGALYAKGPVALVHLLPLALAAPWWAPGRLAMPMARWYGGVLLCLGVAAAAILAWAMPAAQAGGPAYRQAIFWTQSAGRMADSFAHQAPWFTYLVLLPVVLAPWFLWAAWWRGLAAQRGDAALRFVLLGALAALLFFSASSGKRLHYLLPEFLLAALLMARALDTPRPAPRFTLALPAVTLAVCGLALCLGAAPLAQRLGLEPASRLLLQAGGLGPLAAAAWLAWPMRRAPGSGGAPAANPLASARRVGIATVLSLAATMLVLDVALRAPYDMAEVATRLARLQAEGRPLAVRGTSHGEWTFAGRLRQPLQEVGDTELAAWLASHPQGRLVLVHKTAQELPPGARVEYQRRYRGSLLSILAAAGSPSGTTANPP